MFSFERKASPVAWTAFIEGLGISKLQFLIKNSAVFFLQFFKPDPCPDPDSLEMLEPDPYPDHQHCKSSSYLFCWFPVMV
jgi:hypothetical protein